MAPVITTDDYEEAEGHVARNAPAARALTGITACAGDDCHAVWLDKDAGEVWHAWTEAAYPASWTLDRETAAEALPWIRETLTLVLDAIARPAEHYQDGGPRRAERDLDILDEMYQVETAALRHPGQGAGTLSPRAVDRMIRARIDQAQAEAARLSGLRAWHIRDSYGTRHGAGVRAAEALGIAAPTVSALLTADDRRREDVISAAAAPE